MILSAITGPEQAGLRLDEGARQLFPQLSKSRIRTIIDWGGCTVSGAMVRVASRTLREGEEIIVGVLEPELRKDLVYTSADILYEDSSYVAINKATGINSQRTPYQLKGTVEFAVTMYFKEKGINETARVIHRLDRGTSGVMFFPKHKKAATHISWKLKNNEVEKIYWAVVAGVPDHEKWIVDAPIAKVGKFRYGVALPGKDSRTEFRVVTSGAGTTLIEAHPFTGRTHQIRVHLAHSGFPIIGDMTYGGAHAQRMMLHCRSMSFTDVRGSLISATAPVDNPFMETCSQYGIALEP